MRHLSIEISTNSVEFSVLSEHKNITICKRFVFTSENYREELNEFYSSNSFLLEDYSDITLAWSTMNSTLIPSVVFQESTPKELFELCFGKNVEGDVDYNRIPELDLINLYSIPNWVKSFFIIKHPRIIIQHAGSHLLRLSMKENTFRPKVSIVLNANNFLLFLSKHNALEFYAYFEYEKIDDVVYHVLFTMQQKEFTHQEGNVKIIANKGVKNDFLEALTNSLNQIKDIEKYKSEVLNDFQAKAQLQCV